MKALIKNIVMFTTMLVFSRSIFADDPFCFTASLREGDGPRLIKIKNTYDDCIGLISEEAAPHIYGQNLRPTVGSSRINFDVNGTLPSNNYVSRARQEPPGGSARPNFDANGMSWGKKPDFSGPLGQSPLGKLMKFGYDTNMSPDMLNTLLKFGLSNGLTFDAANQTSGDQRRRGQPISGTDAIQVPQPPIPMPIPMPISPPTPSIITNCDPAGCWDNLGGRYNKAAGNTYFRNDGQACQGIGGQMQCN